MRHSAHRSAKTDAFLPTSELAFHVENWLTDGEIRQFSKHVTSTRRLFLSKLEWFLNQRSLQTCGTGELKQFLAYVTRGHEQPGGRWGNPQLTRPVRPRTVKDYHSTLSTFFNWLVAEEMIDASPMQSIPTPISRADQIQHFTDDQVQGLLAAARTSEHGLRDEAILMFLLDTGLRISELCSLKESDTDMKQRQCSVLGKGNKYRTIYFGLDTSKGLYKYMRQNERDANAALFRSERGGGQAFSRFGVRMIIERAGRIANIQGMRCSAHIFRHTMAYNFLRNGGQVFALKELLGHTDIKMTMRYVLLAHADLASQHKQFSPVDNLRKKR